MAFKLAVSNIIHVPVKFTLKEGALNKQFSFTLTGTRKTPEELEDQPEQTIKEFLLENITDWSGQRLVLTENGEPAPFGPEAFDYLLKQPGVLLIIWAAYQRECGGKEKN